VNKTDCTFEDLARLVYYNTSYPYRSYYNLTTKELLPYLCSSAMQGMTYYSVFRVLCLKQDTSLSWLILYCTTGQKMTL